MPQRTRTDPTPTAHIFATRKPARETAHRPHSLDLSQAPSAPLLDSGWTVSVALRGLHRDSNGVMNARHPSAVAAVVAPLLGAVVAVQFHFPTLQGYWQGLIIQSALLLAPLDLLLHHRGTAWIGLQRRGLHRSLAIGGGLAALYLVGLLALAAAGIRLPHFDGARAQLGLLPVLALYIPFWGVLEGIWVNYLIRTISAWLGADRPSWPAILLAAIWFGLVHVLVQVLQGTPLIGAASSLYIGLFAVLAGFLLRSTCNGWGFVLFWTIVNF